MQTQQMQHVWIHHLKTVQFRKHNEFIIIYLFFEYSKVKMNRKEQVCLEVKKMGLIGVTNEISILTRFNVSPICIPFIMPPRLSRLRNKKSNEKVELILRL